MPIDIKGNKVTIDFDPKSTTPSASGKTIVLGTSHGFQWIGDIGVSFNIVKKQK